MSDREAQARKERARLASNQRWSRPGEREAQSKALRVSLRAQVIRQIDPDGLMGPEELEKAIVNEHKARMAKARAARAAKLAAEKAAPKKNLRSAS